MPPKRKCHFTDDLRRKYPCFGKSRSEFEAKCQICDSYVSIANSENFLAILNFFLWERKNMRCTDTRISSILSGSTDLEKHINTPKHARNIRDASTSKSMTNFVVHKSTPLALKISAAEGTLAFHIMKHHNSFKSMDCTSTLLRTLFDDSDIAKKISCARTKTEAIINGVLSPHCILMVSNDLKNISFVSISTDSSNHGNKKLFPIVVQYFDHIQGGIQVRMLDLQEINNETAETVTSLIEGVITKHNLNKKIIAFSGDNTNTNFGGLNRKGEQNIFHLLKNRVNSELVGIGCSAHILHNAIHHGLDQFGLFDIDVLVLKIFNFFSIYTVRTNELKEFCDFVEVTYRNLLYHSKTRWLSLLPAVHRILQMFPALKPYFLSQNKSLKILEAFFLDDFSECYLYFIHSIMSLFYEKIKDIEKENNSILEIMAIIGDTVESLRERIDSKFLPLSIKLVFSKLKKDGKGSSCDNFAARALSVYEVTEEYLRK
ncbi:protein FAM200B-like [Linepithema humile]|uniref:protein FAM200B-like n=1 Tax=Linepithema humile TaxID=83485 RepID=UPI00351E71B4